LLQQATSHPSQHSFQHLTCLLLLPLLPLLPLAAGCHAARPLADGGGRQLLGVNCGGPGPLAIGPHRAVALPRHGVILGSVQFRNTGPRPFGFNNAGFRLQGWNGPIDCNLRCPQNIIPAGGAINVSVCLWACVLLACGRA
jgi:hypothetical protein